MKHIGPLVLLIGLLTADSWGHGQETYTIKLKTPAKGEVVRVTKTSTTTTERKGYSVGEGDYVEEKSVVERTFVYTETVFERDANNRPTRLRRQYEEAQQKTSSEETGKPSIVDKAETLAFDGKTVMIEKRGERYRFQLEGGAELPADKAEPLDREFSSGWTDGDKLVLPGKPVKVSETWNVDTYAAEVAKSVKKDIFSLDVAKASGTCKLVKAYKKDGRQFGTMELQMELPLKSLQLGTGRPLDLQAGARFAVNSSMDRCIDGSADEGTETAMTQFNASGSTAFPKGGKLKMALSVSVSTQETNKEVGKK